MGAMTMVFRVEDPSLLASFGVGDKVKFVPAKKNGQFVVQSMEKAD
jgi:Cu/Ag efflux protein CusF